MGRRGPKPQPAGVKEQKAPVRSRHRKTVSAAQPGAIAGAAGEVPKWLKGEALKVFQRMAPMLRGMKLLTDADVPAFARYATHYARWLDLQKRLKKGGDIYAIETASGKVLRAHPAFTMADRLDRMMLAFEDRFGLNPAERQRIMMARANTGTHDLFGATAPTAKDVDRREGDVAADPAPAVEPSEGPIGLLN